jgi:hypothetical protein
MKTIQGAALAEFQTRDPANRLLIEAREDEVVIHATADSLSEAQKLSFVHYLAVEGFIPAQYLWLNAPSPYARCSVRWVIEAATMAAPTPTLAGRTLAVLRTALPLLLFFIAWLICVVGCLVLCKLCVWP